MTRSSRNPPTVAVIGCGPAGMFFLHAIETQRRLLSEKGDTEGLESLPIATCFDRAPSPGGVWRAERAFNDENERPLKRDHENKTINVSANMYEALWTNGAKENTEFYDYTYDEHFACRLPVHMPRRAILDYMITRVTRNCPDLFEKSARFNTNVISVEYNDTKEKFEVVTRNLSTGIVEIEKYDKCIWAAGENGKPNMPEKLVSIFAEGNFHGRVIHSSDSTNFEENVKGKRILMIGGSYSAEDLALQAIKLGAEKIYISHQKEWAIVTETSTWPQNKVEVLAQQVPVGVTDGGQCIQFAKVSYDYNEIDYVQHPGIETEIRDIDTVVFCTGYEKNMAMLHESLRPPTKPGPEDDFSVPPDWQMTPNEFTPDLGVVPVGNISYHHKLSYVQPGLYRNVLMSNPSMMFAFAEEFEEPLLGSDAIAWQFLAYIMGTTQLPSKQEMVRRNNKQFQREMQIPSYRYALDTNYREAMDSLDDSHWQHDDEHELTKSVSYKEYSYAWLVASIHANDGHYPVDIGSHDDDTLSEIGKKYYDLSCKGGRLRTLPDAKDNDSVWRTFRDYDTHHAEEFASVFTGTKAVPLKKRWMDIDEEKDKLW